MARINEEEFLVKFNEAYEYAKYNAWRFEDQKFLQKDLIHDTMLSILEDKEKFMGVKFIKSWILTTMKYINCNKINVLSHKLTDNYLASVLEYFPGTKYKDVELSVDLNFIIKYIDNINKYDGFNGNTNAIIEEYLQGYKSEEIAKKVGVSTQYVRNCVSVTRKRLKKEFEYQEK